jgi:phosphoribosyl-ATP pyrophosphohydrolase
MGKAAKKKKAPVAAKAAKAPVKAKRKAKPAALPTAAAKGKAKAKLPKTLRKAEKRVLAPLATAIAVPGADASILDRLWQVVEERRQAGDTMTSHSARLLARGTAKVAQKLGEEAVECVIEAATGNRAATVLESADLLYHLMVVWVDAGIRPEEVWGELARRQGISGIAEKAARPRGILRAAGTSKLP